MIRIIAKEEEGKEHLKILRYLRQHQCTANHALPLLDELYNEATDSTFAVFPMLCLNSAVSNFHTVSEVLDFVKQLFEVSVIAQYSEAPLTAPFTLRVAGLRIPSFFADRSSSGFPSSTHV